MDDTPHATRRGFLMLLSEPGAASAKRPAPLRPPWTDETSLAACTACGACVKVCPTGIVALSDALPVLSFDRGECTFCGACADHCKEPVFDRSGPAFRHAVAIASHCLPKRGVICQSCADACPESAIRFRPRMGAPFLPEIDASLCTGCGACVACCPVDAVRIEAVCESSEPVDGDASCVST